MNKPSIRKSPAAESHLSADGRFRSYAREARRRLMQEVVADEGALAAVIYHLLEAPEARAGRAATVYAGRKGGRGKARGYVLKRPPDELHLELKARLGDAVAAAADTLLLRHLTARLLEAFYPDAAEERRGPGEACFSREEVELAHSFPPPHGGDFHPADLCGAARAAGEALRARAAKRGPAPSKEFWAGEGDGRPDFRYEDLRPKTLQDCYEDSLSTAVRVTRDAGAGGLRVEVGASNRRRKELGAYYTNEHLCRFMVERAVKPLFEERLERLRRAAAGGPAAEARAAFEAVMNFSVCDPTMGGAPFLRAAFEYLAGPAQYTRLRRRVAALRRRHAALYEEAVAEYEFLGAGGGPGAGGWEWHVLRCVLYGVDIDLRAVRVACQTFALSPARRLRDGERFPSYFNTNLRHGNALVSPTRPEDRARLAAEHGAALAELIRLRRRAQGVPSVGGAYAELARLFAEADRVRLPLLQGLVERRVRGVLGDFTEELRPFCWELEYPEVFFNEEGTLKEAPGFDVVIGNPPWEAIKYNDGEFLRSFGAGGGQSCEEGGAAGAAYAHYREVTGRWKRWVADGGQYEHQRGGRDRNKWRLATEVSWKLTREGGALGLVLPGGIIADEGAYALKRWLFPEGEAQTFVSFDEANDLFPGTQGFTLTGFRKGRPTREVRHLEGLKRGEQLTSPPYAPSGLPLETVERMSPAALAVPSVRDEVDASILRKLYAHPLMVDPAAAWHARTVSYDYHVGHGRAEFERGGPVVLVEGKNVGQYEVAPAAGIEKRVAARRQSEPGGRYRIACADVAGVLLARRMLCAPVPHGYATGDNLNCLLVEGGDDAERLLLVGCLNSLVVEWRVRQIARSNHVKKFMLAQLPAPRPPRADVLRVAALVAALVTPDARFEDLRPLLGGAAPAAGGPARHDLRCRIDAEVARLFGLGGDELERVLGAFDKVPDATKLLVRAHFESSAAG